jgi:hypothetical protein
LIVTIALSSFMGLDRRQQILYSLLAMGNGVPLKRMGHKKC